MENNYIVDAARQLEAAARRLRTIARFPEMLPAARKALVSEAEININAALARMASIGTE